MSNFTISSSYPVPSVMSRTEFEDIIKNLVPASDLIASSDLHISNNKIAIKAGGVDIDQLDLASSNSNLEDAGLGKIRVAQTMTGLTSVTSSSFSGALTGNVTGNLTGNINSASGNVEVNPASQILEVKGDGTLTEGQIQLNCHANSHGQKITAADHSVGATNTLTLPGGSTIGNSDATLVSDTGTQTLTNKTLTAPTITGSGAIAGVFTGDLTGDVTGNVTGNVTGDLTGDVTGDVTGNLTGDVTGNVTGDLTGDVSGNATTATTAGTVSDATQSAITTASNLTSIGTITTGTWNASVISTSYGGTGLSTVGTAGQILATNSGETGLEWVDNTPTLEALTDTNIASPMPNDDYILVFDNATDKWVHRNTLNGVLNQMSVGGAAQSGKELTVVGDTVVTEELQIGDYTRIKTFDSTDTDPVNGSAEGATGGQTPSTFGSLITGYPEGHVVVQIQGNDQNDGFHVLVPDDPATSTNADKNALRVTSSSTVINESGRNHDFRVEGDTNSNLLFCDASADTVEIGNLSVNGSTSSGYELTCNGNLRVEGTGASPSTEVYVRDNGSNAIASVFVAGTGSGASANLNIESNAGDAEIWLTDTSQNSSSVNGHYGNNTEGNANVFNLRMQDNIFDIRNYEKGPSGKGSDYNSIFRVSTSDIIWNYGTFEINGDGTYTRQNYDRDFIVYGGGGDVFRVDGTNNNVIIKQIETNPSSPATGTVYKDSNGFLKIA